MVHPLHLHAVALPANVGVLRRGARRWLAGAVDDPGVVDDLTLAVSEALENAADHAFAGLAHPGTMTVQAEVDEVHGVTIRVRDDGSWRSPTARTTRGRGIALMEALADSAVVEVLGVGTSVTLTRRLPRPAVPD